LIDFIPRVWYFLNMYYSYTCPYCGRLFYVFNDSKDEAAKELFDGIKKHEEEYGEDTKDGTLTEYDPETEADMIYEKIQGSETIPSGGYPLE
jgi:hypothetical protein